MLRYCLYSALLAVCAALTAPFIRPDFSPIELLAFAIVVFLVQIFDWIGYELGKSIAKR